MSGDKRDRIGEHVDAALADDRYVGEPPAELDDPPPGTPGCALGCVAVLALLLIVAALGFLGAVLLWW